jgi:DNA polymerase-4
MELQAERIIDQTLRTKPIAIISSHHDNGSIVALSREAKEEGLFRGMKIHMARKMSHSVRMLPYNRNLYSRVHKNISKTICNYTPVFEPEAFGQYYMDMTGTSGLLGRMNDVGLHITRNIKNQLNMQSKIGISTNKLVSKLSTEVVPETVWHIKNGNETKFVAPLSPMFLPVCKENPIKKLIRFLMLITISQVQDIFKIPQLAHALFGHYYSQLDMQVFGKDISPVYPLLEKTKISEQKILSHDSNDYHLLQSIVRELCGHIGFRMRSSFRSGKQISIEIHYTDGFLNKRKNKLSGNDDHTIIDICTSLLDKVFTRRNRVRSIIISVTDLFSVSRQLSFFDQSEVRQDNISSALDKVRSKFGNHSIHNGFSSDLYSKNYS